MACVAKTLLRILKLANFYFVERNIGGPRFEALKNCVILSGQTHTYVAEGLEQIFKQAKNGRASFTVAYLMCLHTDHITVV